MNKEEFAKCILAHKSWLETRTLWNVNGAKMSLEYEVLVDDWQNIDFSHASMSRCIFRTMTFYKCVFDGFQTVHSSFFGCRFIDCKFRDASFTSDVLYCCEFRMCNFEKCSFAEASISTCEFGTSRLENCSFYKSNILCTGFENAEFVGDTLFEGANIQNTYLPQGLRNILGRILDKPIIGYKKTREGVVIKAEIPAGAIVFSINGKKCRTNRAKIIDMQCYTMLTSSHDSSFRYTLGQEIEILDFDPCYNHECAPGFHFFMTKKEAEDYSV